MRSKQSVVLAVLLTTLFAFGVAGSLRADSYHLPFDISMEPRMPLGESRHVTMDIRVKANSAGLANSKCTITSVIFLHGDMTDTLAKQVLTTQFDSTCTASTNFEIALPDHEIVHLDVIVGSIGHGAISAIHRFFSTMEDETKFIISAPNHRSPTVEKREREKKAKLYTYRGLNPDTLTSDQLQTQYDVVLGLNTTEKKEKVEKLIGEISDTCEATDRPGITG